MSSVEQLIEKARIAQQVYENYDQGAVDEVVTAVAWALIEPGRNRELSQMAVETTGLGKIEDKILKNERKTLGLLRDLRSAKSVGVISEDEELGITEIARPVGVVAAVTPSTNPVATPTNNTLNALKGRNAIIIAPSPAGEKVCSRLLQYFHEELRRIGAPVDLIQQLPSPVDKIRTLELMKLADWLIVTGSQSNVRAAYSSGTPAIGVGAGNVTVIVDETADLDAAAIKIMKSKTFDHATSCSSENALVVVDKIYDTFLEKLGDCGGRLLDEQEKQTLQDSLWVNGKLNRQMLARDAGVLCQMADLKRNDSTETKFLMVEESGIGPDFPFSGEKL
ncbi:MAG: aldehyde dehydrogenase family protein, partial [SAR324 cluster bacterium]|nr:aldehyde dehydrogenase family protein [SAR324 cluster bacterium]